MDIEKAKATIRGLLNLSKDSAAAQGEIDNAIRFAARLMAQHQLSEDDVSAVDEKILDLDRAECARQFAYGGCKQNSGWEGQVAMFVCKLVGGIKCYLAGAEVYRPGGIVQLDKNGNPEERARVAFYGIAEDVAIAVELFGEIIVTIAALARLKWGTVYRGDGRSYCDGFVDGLFTSLRKDTAEQTAIAHSPTNTSGSNALALIENRALIVAKKTALAAAFQKKVVGKLRGRTASSNRINRGAYAAGRTDGANYNATATRRQKIAN